MSEIDHGSPEGSSRPNPPVPIPAAGRESRGSWRPLVILFTVSGFFFLIFVVSSYLFFSKGLEGNGNAPQKGIFKKDGVALLEINGVIMDSKKALKSLKGEIAESCGSVSGLGGGILRLRPV